MYFNQTIVETPQLNYNVTDGKRSSPVPEFAAKQPKALCCGAVKTDTERNMLLENVEKIHNLALLLQCGGLDLRKHAVFCSCA